MRRAVVLVSWSLLVLVCASQKSVKAQGSPACSAQHLTSLCSSVPSTTPASCPNCPKTYVVHSYQGQARCLDYTPEVSGSPIFINDCSQSHPIIVEETGDGKHSVILHAGTKVIGIKTKIENSAFGSPSAAAMAVQNTGVNAAGVKTQAAATGGGTPSASAKEAPLQHTEVNVVGVKMGPETITGANPTPDPTEIPLQLLDWNHLIEIQQPFSQDHLFALDGDSIILVSNRNLVAKVQNARGAIGSPLVMGPRQLADNEFWDFAAIGGAPADPTTGFVRIGYDGDTYCANPAMCTCRLFNVVTAASANPGNEGTVVKLGTSFDLTDCPQLIVGQGVTIRGDRRGTNSAPELKSCYVVNGATKCDSSQNNAETIEPMVLFTEDANDIRLTGLRLRGPSRSTDQNQTEAIGVISFEANLRNIIDHNDVSDWPYIGVMTKAHDSQPLNSTCDPKAKNDPQTRPTTAFVARNFIHHNMEEEAGYGTETDYGAYPFVFGNTFVSNRHAIAAGKGTAHTAYRAWYNLVLSSAPLQHGIFHTHDFDMHGLGDNGFGGIGGDYIDIYRNTFFATNRNNFELRGDICNYAEFHNNISLESKGDAVNWQTCPNVCWGGAASPSLFRISDNPNQFDYANPAYGPTVLGVGDFDGDKADDLFLATGTAWYYSAGGKTEWRFLSPKTETIGQLLLGDFDGDGRTDVVTLQDGKFMVSWGGLSTWELLNPNPTAGRLTLLPSAVTAMAVGDFDGNKLADIFWADGQTWWVSYGGTTAFQEVQTSSFHRSDLRFGDFNGDGRTDVFGISNTDWEVSYAPFSGQGLFSSWRPLRARLTNTVAGLVVADFNGDGHADVATDCDGSKCWRISYRGFENWITIAQPASLSRDLAGVGHFRAAVPADVLTWNSGNGGVCDITLAQGTEFCIAVAGIEPAAPYSTQDMR
jgi:hypothetical protein